MAKNNFRTRATKKGGSGKQLDDSTLKALCESRKESSMGSDRDGDDLSTRRENNLKRYLGQPYGDERKGQSRVVTRECLEAVEWSLPSLMRIFASSDVVVEFQPTGSADEEASKQETAYVNHVYSKENEGFDTTYTWIKSMLINPVAYIKSYWEEGETVTHEEYTGLFPAGIAELESDPELEAVEAEETTVPVEQPDGSVVDMPCYTVKFKRTQIGGKLIVHAVPPEEMNISGQWAKVSLEGCDYICHTTHPTRTELIDRGYDKDLVYTLPTYNGKRIEQDEAEQRHDDTVGSDGEYDDATDRSTEQVEVDEHYLWIDYDGDGAAEYRMVTISGQEILENDEIEDHPFTAGCAVPVPFSHVGIAWQELVEDLQKIKTTLTRQFLNNLYRVNNPRTVVGRGVNLADVINDLPNSPIRAKDINQLRVEPTQSVVANIAPAFGMIEDMKEKRTGVSKSTMGLDADALSRVGNGAFYASLEQANQRLELLARIIAEMSFKPLFLKIHKTLMMNQTNLKEFKLRGEWIPIKPDAWDERSQMEVKVGLGTGNKQTQAAALDKIMEVQGLLKKTGSRMVSDANIFKSCEDLVLLAGKNNPGAYFTDPATLGPAPPKQDPEGQVMKELIKVEKAKMELKAAQEKAELMQKHQKETGDLKMQIAELQQDTSIENRKLDQGDWKLEIDEFKAETDAEIDAARVLQDDERLDQTQVGES
ncbi:MAG: hypothetical protein KAR40_07955 [Candidatus Sabulitectum sp.]|nr:hypothetical protein [Candidatus Sabulitectum sp.]